ncbi:ABC transporter substrate-binding protein [Noviherbaspirillum sedimenti]|uniref:ABC transporter substrate-binding protein n=1 Tax=Noviherbaspirillum sedimenti TaxID=2320865 RepID=A0A3A3G757_9BURK|nr:ABC transporter substrate-binding protein [Noviherbaspirillum sedimenti]RJG02569.1 ABC transporter substrate-binding protein [Noviherbaspirillum sedimenti]
MKSFTKFKLIAAALGMALSAGAFAQNIKIGAILSVTGPAAFLGTPEQQTLQLYVEKINSEGGLLGRKLELVSYDDASEANKSNSFTKRLIEEDKVDVLIGGTTTGNTMAAVPLAERAGVPFISLAAGIAIVEPVKKWVFKTPHSDRQVVERVLRDMQKRGFKKIALLSETSGFGQSGHKEVLALAPTLGMEVVVVETYGPKDTDMTAQLTKIKGNPAVQSVFVFGLGQGPAIVSKNMAQLGMKTPHYESHGVASEQFIKLAGPSAEGIRLPATALLVPEKLPAGDIQKKVVTDYTKAFNDRYKVDPSAFGGNAHDGIMLYVDAVKRANSTDKEKVRAALESTRKFVGTNGVVNMSATDHSGLDLSGLRMLEIRNNDWTLIND